MPQPNRIAFLVGGALDGLEYEIHEPVPELTFVSPPCNHKQPPDGPLVTGQVVYRLRDPGGPLVYDLVPGP